MTAEPSLNMLTEPLFSVRPAGVLQAWSLPVALAALAKGVDPDWAGLRPHQEHAWHAFLVQLAALALERAGVAEPPTAENEWHHLLLALTHGHREPWCLLVPDVSLPAFFQPPIPEGQLEALTKTKVSPDEIDVLITAKNHDLKQTRMTRARPEHWAYALASLQTMEGWGGATNYGIARMKSQYGNRPCLGATPSLDRSAWWRRDVAAWRESRAELIETFGYPAKGGLALLWCEPWDGQSALGLQECDPFFIECCRRVRLEAVGGGLRVRHQGTACSRLAAKEAKGVTGDAWTPIERGDGGILTVGEYGFAYAKLQEVLFGEGYQPGAALKLRPEDGAEPLLVARTLVRGQGKTVGYRQRLLPLSRAVRRLLATAEGRSRLGARAEKQVEAARKMSEQVLRLALAALVRAGGSTSGGLGRFLHQFDGAVDGRFFSWLWASIELQAEEAERGWEQELFDLAQQVLQSAIASSPLPAIRRYKAIAQAEGLFAGLAHKHFDLSPQTAAGEIGGDDGGSAEFSTAH